MENLVHLPFECKGTKFFLYNNDILQKTMVFTKEITNKLTEISAAQSNL